MVCFFRFLTSYVLKKGNSKPWSGSLLCYRGSDYVYYHFHVGKCGTVQFKLDIYMCVALELFNECWVTRELHTYEHMIQHHNSILNPYKWCTHEVHYLQVTYRILHVNCMRSPLWIIIPLIPCYVHRVQTFQNVNYKCPNHSITVSNTAGIVQFVTTVPK